jgi:hypothetical protein
MTSASIAFRLAWIKFADVSPLSVAIMISPYSELSLLTIN